MSQPAIRVENLGKQFRIGARELAQRTFREALSDAAAAPFRRVAAACRPRQRTNGSGAEDDTIWALRDVSFEVQPGEVVGIIGRNGAGKSTLLRILSRITEPTEGRVEVHGRVASLLEVGTGFHPELTGRENIFLNGAILGMSRREILAKFHEIVAFAEVEKFIDTPVKRYSSGMYVRLAFAVAAHLEPEILMVDEVLAVGDAAFQKKCLRKMGDVARGGRTVLFVSHNMAAVQRLCDRALLLEAGSVALSGDSGTAVARYLRNGERKSAADMDLSRPDVVERRGSGAARFYRVTLRAMDGRLASQFMFGEPFRVQMTVLCVAQLNGVLMGFSFVAADGTEIQGTAAHDGGVECNLSPGIHSFECIIDPMVLTPGRYSLRGAIFVPNLVFDHIDEILTFSVDQAVARDSAVPTSHYVGHIYIGYRWQQLVSGIPVSKGQSA